MGRSSHSAILSDSRSSTFPPDALRVPPPDDKAVPASLFNVDTESAASADVVEGVGEFGFERARRWDRRGFDVGEKYGGNDSIVGSVAKQSVTERRPDEEGGRAEGDVQLRQAG